jgi:hypothetical protein
VFAPAPYSFGHELAAPAPWGLGTTMSIQQETGTVGSTVASATAFIPGVGPLVAGAVAAATQLAVVIENIFSGCGATCVQTSQFVNQVEPVLQQNLAAYVGYPVRTQSMQAAHLTVFDQAWAKVLQFCGQAAMGPAGQNCISGRQQGACFYKTSPGGWKQNSDGSYSYVAPGPNGSGSACWNWFVGYRDAIANDPGVIPDPVGTSAADAVNSVTAAISNPSAPSSLMPLLLLALAVVGVSLL